MPLPDLLCYHARYYNPWIARFVSADSVVPGASGLSIGSDKQSNGPVNPQNLNRFAYGLNNPVKNTDPTGHCIDIISCTTEGAVVGTVIEPGGGTAVGGVVGFVIGVGIVIGVGAGIGYLASEAVNSDTEGEEDKQPVPWHTNTNAKGKDKVGNQMGQRGWTPEKVQDTLDNPADTAPGRDTRTDPETGEKTDKGSVTYYYDKDGNYVVRRDDTGEIIQISDRNKPG